MQWTSHPRATEVACKVFPAYQPRVQHESSGKLCRLDASPYGRMEIVHAQEGPFLVAAESPPQAEASIRSVSLPPELLERWNKAGLRPWKVIAEGCRDVCDVISALGETERTDERPAATPVDACLLPPPPAQEIIGTERILLAERLTALAAAHAYPRPVPQLVGPSGIGRRTVTTALAAGGLSLIGELPLGRLGLPRVFSTPGEAVNDVLLAIGQQMSTRDVLLASDAEILARFDAATRGQLLRELSRLPHVILIATVPGRVWCEGLLTLRVGGFEPNEARTWITTEYPEIQFTGAGIELLLRAASLRRSNEVSPGKIRWLIDLARALVRGPPETDPTGSDAPASERCDPRQAIMLSPDEIMASVALANLSLSGREDARGRDGKRP